MSRFAPNFITQSSVETIFRLFFWGARTLLIFKWSNWEQPFQLLGVKLVSWYYISLTLQMFFSSALSILNSSFEDIDHLDFGDDASFYYIYKVFYSTGVFLRFFATQNFLKFDLLWVLHNNTAILILNDIIDLLLCAVEVAIFADKDR